LGLSPTGRVGSFKDSMGKKTLISAKMENMTRRGMEPSRTARKGGGAVKIRERQNFTHGGKLLGLKGLCKG